MVKIGVLGLQGAIAEHVKALQAQDDVEVVVVKRPEELVGLDGLVLPGGESTAMRKLMDPFHFVEALQSFGQEGKPVFGTCAGMILLAKKINGQDNVHVALMDTVAERNAFGRQRESFEATLPVKGVADDFEAVFIRAPYIDQVGDNVEVLATYDGHIVACQDGPFLASAFHPELTEDYRMHAYFVELVKKSKKA